MRGERLLLVEDRPATREVLGEALEQAGYLVCAAEDAEEAAEKLQSFEFDGVVSDLCLPRGSGLAVLDRVRAAGDLTPVILLTGYGTVEQAVDAMKRGAFDFLTKPVEVDHLLMVVERALERRRLLTQTMAFRAQEAATLGMPAIVGESPAFCEVYQAVLRVAPSETTVMFLGESGTGKDLLARALHQASPRAQGPWVAINCAALPRELVESELFGAEKGAFTGAVRRRMGKVELAHGGTLFLDEVSELDPGSQAKLLRVLEEKCFERLGGTRTVHADVRLVAASNQDLTQAVTDRTFREDLYYRLHVFPVVVPPLRERGEDTLLIARHFLARFAREMKRPEPHLTRDAEELLRRHTWPGNVRELRNAIERALILADGDQIDDVHFNLGRVTSGEVSAAPAPGGSWPRLKDASRQAAEEVEGRLIHRALLATGGNRTRAAELLGVSVKTLWAKLRDHDQVPEMAGEDPTSRAG